MNAEGEILDVAGKEISKKELLKKAAPKFEDLQELRGMEDWQRDVAIENAYGFSIASMELPMKLGRFKGGRAYSRVWGETLKFDFVRGVLLKFKTPQPGVAILYMALTGDVRGALEIRKAGYTVGAFIEQYSKTGDENTIAALRNWFGISSRVGPSSRWGIKFGEHGWTRELAEHQGFGLDVNDAKYKIEDRYKQQLERRFEHIKNAGERDIQVRKEMAKLKETIEEEVRGEIKASLIRGGDITPLSIVRFWVRDKEFYKNMNWKANPNTLVDRRRDLLAEIVGNDIVQECLRGRDEHGNLLSPLVVHASVFRHGNDTLWVTNLKRLWIANTANEDIEFPKQHLVGAELERVQAAEVAVREKIIGAVEGDLELVQQKALLRVQRELGSGATREQMQGRNKLLDEDFEVISDDVRRTHAHTYYDKIRKISEDKGFYDRLAERVATGKENYLISTVDLPWNKVRWKDMGGGGFVQAWMDANATMKGEQGVYNYFRGHTGQPKWEELAAILDKDVFSNVMSYDPTIAQRASHTLYKGSLIFYKEHPWATRLGPIGDFVWGASWFSRILEERKAYGSMVSPAKMFIGYDATHLGPNNLHRAIRIGNDKNLFAKDPIPLDWGAGEDYTALSLEKEVGATPRDMAAEVLFYLFPFGLPLGMVLEGGREQIEEEKKK
ncbi:hypothetical protein HY031_02350 [Candidatus Gottesmanbacteria bacterium]|nr:hypothetical protein [Candidatus Gottesmanbacteria bacterium]